jgi:hypothetical protein
MEPGRLVVRMKEERRRNAAYFAAAHESGGSVRWCKRVCGSEHKNASGGQNTLLVWLNSLSLRLVSIGSQNALKDRGEYS